MSNFASNLASLARSKLHSALSSGARDNVSLHRWVLLKNSIVHNANNSHFPVTQNDASDEDYTEEDYSDNSDEYEDVFSFLFPDPGEAVSDDVGDASISEAQWLDSLLETLGEDDDEDIDNSIDKVSGLQRNNIEFSPNIACTSSKADSEYIAPRAIIHYPVPYPPLHPPLVQRYYLDFSTDSSSQSSPSSPSDSSFPSSPVDCIPFRGARTFYLSMPDVIEDISDDETEAPTTPYTRSRSSLHSVDPSNIPSILNPGDRTRMKLEPRVYSEADEAFFHPFKLDPLPYANNFDPSPFHNPFHQNC